MTTGAVAGPGKDRGVTASDTARDVLGQYSTPYGYRTHTSLCEFPVTAMLILWSCAPAWCCQEDVRPTGMC